MATKKYPVTPEECVDIDDAPASTRMRANVEFPLAGRFDKE